ncbi:hypothetical protein Q7C36_008317 [Tachysurus vachellii]|uniref:Uncharacterized protein n=1 Tax=Tachysurus vachellii TaxID=175792 RepID=A0AA88ND80_TACVA|nr:hypothetical protein Q7C36_008317 [Tachysurus vachellii]
MPHNLTWPNGLRIPAIFLSAASSWSCNLQLLPHSWMMESDGSDSELSDAISAIHQIDTHSERNYEQVFVGPFSTSILNVKSGVEKHQAVSRTNVASLLRNARFRRPVIKVRSRPGF